ncbi:MAG TPA: ion channel [Steroidobacteraceae bacterium]|nr:ion channel [Steroidobacteraceae bacterium]
MNTFGPSLPVVTLETLQSRSVVVMLTTLAVVVCVVLHYEALSALTSWLKKVQLHPRPRILLLIFAILFTHVVEVWIFGLLYYVLISGQGHGALYASYPIGLLDCIYFSATCFTTLGLGDITPLGAVRFLTGTEALTGFVLLTWSASFTFVEMQRFWKT